MTRVSGYYAVSNRHGQIVARSPKSWRAHLRATFKRDAQVIWISTRSAAWSR